MVVCKNYVSHMLRFYLFLNLPVLSIRIPCGVGSGKKFADTTGTNGNPIVNVLKIVNTRNVTAVFLMTLSSCKLMLLF
jgi:hypothetical protein